jgi:hypothetical protein
MMPIRRRYPRRRVAEALTRDPWPRWLLNAAAALF